jgi:glycosyltransferase 2 family protein
MQSIRFQKEPVTSLMTDNKKSKWKKRLVMTGQIAVAILLLSVIAFKIDLPTIYSVLRQAIGPGFLALIVLFLATKVLFAWQMQRELICHGIRIGLARLVKIYLIVSFYALAIPGDLAAGGITWIKLGKEAKAWAESGISIVYLRLLNTLFLFIIGTIGIMADPFFFSTRFRPVFIIAIIMLTLSLVPFFSPVVACALEKCLNRMLGYMPARISQLSVWSKCFSVLREFPGHTRGRLLGCVVLSLLTHGCNIAQLYIASQILSLDLPFTVMVWLSPVLTILGMFPFAFGGLGVREGLLLLILSPYPVSNAQKVAFSLLIYLVSLLTGGLLGAFFEMKDALFARRHAANGSGLSARRRD